MFKAIYLFLVLFIPFLTLQGEPARDLSLSFVKIINPKKVSFIPTARYADGAEKIIKLILETMGLQASFEVRKANVPNAAAVVYQGKRYILYNPAFISAMNKAAGTPWASVAVLAHEIGHHLNGHTLDGKGSLPAIELEADEFSGFVLRKMGASLSDAQLAMRIIATPKATSTHPARNDRLMAIADGWNRASKQLAGGDLSRKEIENRADQNSILSEDYITYDVHFSFDPNARYHVTSRNNLVKILDNELQVLGRLLATGKSTFPLAFQTGVNDFLLIRASGRIINKQGKVLGYITPRK